MLQIHGEPPQAVLSGEPQAVLSGEAHAVLSVEPEAGTSQVKKKKKIRTEFPVSDSESDIGDYDWGIHDDIMCLALREIYSFNEIQWIIRSRVPQLVRTKQGILLQLRGKERDKLEVDYDIERSKVPRQFILRLRDFEDR